LLAGILVGVLHLPPLQRYVFEAFVVPAAEAATGLKLSARSVRWNLLGAVVDLGGVILRAPGYSRPVLSLDRLELRLPLASLLGTWTFEVGLDRPELWLEADAAGLWNVPLLNPSDAEPQPAGPATGDLELPDYEIRSIQVRSVQIHVRRNDLTLDLEPSDLTANVRLASLQGELSLRLGRGAMQLAGRPLQLGSLELEAKAASGGLSARIRGDAPGLQLDSSVALASLRGLDGLSGAVELRLDPARLPADLIPAAVTGPVEARAELNGSLLAPRVELQLEAPELSVASELAGLSARATLRENGSVQASVRGTLSGASIQGSVDLASLSGEARLSGRATATADVSRVASELLASRTTGQARIQIGLGGTAAAPEARTRIEAEGLSWEGRPLPGLRGTLDAGLSGTSGTPWARCDLELVETADPTARPRPSGRLRVAVENGAIDLQELRLIDGATSLLARGRWSPAQEVRLEIDATSEALDRYAELLGIDLAGSLSAHASVRGPLDRPDAAVRFELRDGRYAGRPLQGRGRMELSSGALQIEELQVQAAGVEARVSGRADLEGLLAGTSGSEGNLLVEDLQVADAGLRADALRVRLQSRDSTQGPQIAATAVVEKLAVAGRDLGFSRLELQATRPAGRSLDLSAQLFDGQAEILAQRRGAGLSGRIVLRDLDLGPWMKGAVLAGAEATGKLSGRLDFSAPELELGAMQASLLLDRLEGSLGSTTFELQETPASVNLEPGGRLASERLQLDLGGGDKMELRGEADLIALRGRGAIDLRLDLAKLAMWLPEPIQGRLEASAELRHDGVRGSIDLIQVEMGPWLGLALPSGVPAHGTMSGRVEVDAAKLTFEAAQGRVRLDQLEGAAGTLGFKLASSPAVVTLDPGGRLGISGDRLKIELGGEDRIELNGAFDLGTQRGKGTAAMHLDLAKIGPLLGLELQGRVSAAAEARANLGPAGEGARVSVRVEEVQIEPWLEGLGLTGGPLRPQGLLSAEASVHARGLRPEDIEAQLKVPRLELKLDTLQASSRRPIELSFDGRELRVDSLEIGLAPDEQVGIRGSLWPAEARVEMTAAAQLDLERLSSLAGRPLSGRLDANLRASGPLDAPGIEGIVRASGIQAGELGAGALDLRLEPTTPDGPHLGAIPLPTASLDAREVRAQGVALGRVQLELAPLELQAGGGPGIRGTASIGGIRLGDRPVGDLEAELALDPNEFRLEASGLGGALEARAVLALGSGGGGEAALALRSVGLGPFLELADLPFEAPPQGRISATGRLRLPEADLARAEGGIEIGELSLGLDRVELALEAPARAKLAAGRLRLEPLTLLARDVSTPERRERLTLEGQADAERVELRVVGAWPLASIRPFVPAVEALDGLARLELAVEGPPQAPRIRGSVGVNGGRLVYAQPRLEIQGLEARLRAEGSRIHIESVKGTLGGGLVSARGRIDLEKAGEPAADLTVRALGARVQMPELDLDTTADAELTYKGPVASGLLEGNVRLSQTRYTPRLSPVDLLVRLTQRVRVVEPLMLDPGLFAGAQDAPVIGAEPQLNLAISAAAGSISVDSGNVQAQAQAELQVVGKPSVPGVLGLVEVSDGSINLYATKFGGLRGTIDFERDPLALDPKLDLQATAVKGSEEVTLRIGGRAMSPALELRSSSGQPQVEVVKTLVGGSSEAGESGGILTTDQLSGLAAQQAASIASQQISSAVGLDLELVPPPLGRVPLLFALGKQVSEKLHVKFYKVDSPSESNIYEVRFDASETLQIEARRTEVQSNAVRVRLRKRFD
jgi:autotransporter translocation and assembly factor TamB